MSYDIIDNNAWRTSPPHPLELNRAVPGGRVEMFAVRDGDYPSGWFYRFQYYAPDDGAILRYDNAHDDDNLGKHHRHIRAGEDTEIDFHGIVPHVARFLTEVDDLAESGTDTDTTNP